MISGQPSATPGRVECRNMSDCQQLEVTLGRVGEGIGKDAERVGADGLVRVV